MRERTIFLVAVACIAIAIIVASSRRGVADDNYEQRISDLETRVAALETAVGISTPVADSDDQPSSTTSGSSQSSQSSQGGSFNSFSASYAANGNRDYELKIENGGTYHLTVHLANAPVTVAILDANGDPLPEFAIEAGEGKVTSATGDLAQGTYTLRVESDSQWALILVSAGS